MGSTRRRGIDGAEVPNRRPPARSGSLTVDGWTSAALRAIAENGVGGVAVEPLAQRLGVTKGSFYWHFPNRDALLGAALSRWEEATTALIGALEQMPDPADRLRQLVAYVLPDAMLASDDAEPWASVRHLVDLAIADAADDPIVRPVLRRVSERRLAYLEACCRELGLAPEAARNRSLLLYAAYVGTLRLVREVPGCLSPGDEYTAYRRHLIASLVLPGPTPSAPESEPPTSPSLDVTSR